MSSSRMAASTGQSVLGPSAVRVSLDLRTWLYAAVLVCLVVSLGFVYLIQAGHVARQIEAMEDLEVTLQHLKQNNSAVLLEIGQFEQAARIKQQARQLGFAEPEHVDYIVVQMDEGASRAQDPLSYADPDRQEASSPTLTTAGLSRSWRRVLLDQFSDWMKVAAAHKETR